MSRDEVAIVKKKMEMAKTLKQKLYTVSHILNRLAKGCIVEHAVDIYDSEGDIIIDVHLAPFLNTVKYYEAIQQVESQLLMDLYSRGHSNPGRLNYFDKKTIKGGRKNEDECFIRITVYERPLVELILCKKCGAVTTRNYENSRNFFCPTHGLLDYDGYKHVRMSTGEWKPDE